MNCTRSNRWMPTTIVWTLTVTAVLLFGLLAPSVSSRKIPDASSTLLKMHRLYSQQPPHDTKLYDILRVSPNATLAQIQKSYRKLTREFHPDKAAACNSEDNDNNNNNNNNDHPTTSTTTTSTTQSALEQVREAYDILKEDSTRLPYHQYGLMEARHAAFVLTGAAVTDEDQRDLLRLMGYPSNPNNNNNDDDDDDRASKNNGNDRVAFLAANLLERMRPLVEGAMTKAMLADSIAQECDRLKTLPLGAHILRCIGRAYRHAGQKVLRKHQRNNKKRRTMGGDVSDQVRDKMRDAKQVLTAVAAGGRLVLTEQMTKSRLKNQSTLPRIGYVGLGELITDPDDLASELHTEDDIKIHEHQKAQQAILESLQIEALWKITKVDLDRTIQEACALILDGNYFFFPSHQSPRRGDRTGGDGWVGSTGKAIDTNVGRLMAASALVLMGDVMVRCSKEGTSWME